MSGRSLSSAPSNLNSGSLPQKPNVVSTAIVTSPNNKALMTKLLRLSVSPLPINRANAADKPEPKPMMMLEIIKVSGKVKLIAVNASVPSKLIKKVSVMLNSKILKMPRPVGILIEVKTWRVGALSKSCFKMTLRERIKSQL